MPPRKMGRGVKRLISAFLTSAAYFRASTKHFPGERPVRLQERGRRARPLSGAPQHPWLVKVEAAGRRAGPGEGVFRARPAPGSLLTCFTGRRPGLAPPELHLARGEQGEVLGSPRRRKGAEKPGCRRKKTWRGRSWRKCDNKSEIKGRRRRRLSLLSAPFSFSLSARVRRGCFASLHVSPASFPSSFLRGRERERGKGKGTEDAPAAAAAAPPELSAAAAAPEAPRLARAEWGCASRGRASAGLPG